jgi:hypothetical protein
MLFQFHFRQGLPIQVNAGYESAARFRALQKAQEEAAPHLHEAELRQGSGATRLRREYEERTTITGTRQLS